MTPRLAILVLLALPSAALARGGGGCLEAGTAVLTPAGPTAIEALRPGDRVISIRAGAARVGQVLSCLSVRPEQFVELTLDNGATIRATAEHPFMVADGEFVAVGQLRSGQTIQLWGDGRLSPATLRHVGAVKAERRAYNLLVWPDQTFIANGAVVHNKGCFLPDTPILLADGSATSISRLQVGQRLMAFNPDGGITSAAVRRILTAQADEYVVVRTERVELRVTREHPFYVGEGRYKTVARLAVGDYIFAFDGAGLSRQRITGIRPVAGPVLVYNLQVDQPNTFFAAGVAVHNKGGGCFLPETPILLADGSSLPIARVRAGQQVLTFAPDGQIVAATVRQVFQLESPRHAVLRTDRAEVRATLEHPFYVGGGEFCTLSCLAPGQTVYAYDGGGLTPQEIQSIQVIDRPSAVYNLQVDYPNTFFAAGLAVHNKGGGGGSHGGGFHGSGSGSGSGTYVNVPALVIIGAVFGIFIVISVLSKRSKLDQNLDFCYGRSDVAPKTDKTRKLLEFIARTDTDFQPDKLVEAARSTFLKLQECWSAREYAPMRPLMMPDLYANHCQQLSAMKGQHEINMIADLAVEQIDLVNVRYTHKNDEREFTALITASARDFYVDDRTQDLLRGDQEPARFQEFWTFQRQGKDWLLREVEQSRESDVLKDENFFEQFTDRGRDQVYGETAGKAGPAGPWLEKAAATKAVKIERMLNFLAATDKLWARQAMLDRAREVFVRVYTAQEAGDPAGVPSADLFPPVAASLAEMLTARRQAGTTMQFRNLCVRKVELLLVRNYADNANDEFTVRISAHAQRIIAKGGRTVQADEYVTPFTEYWTFGRLDKQWKLKEVLPPAAGEQALSTENLDEDSTPEQVQWYYRQTRAT